MAVPLGRLEFEIGEPQGDAAPGEALAAHLAAPGPEEGTFGRGRVGVAQLIHEQLRVGLPVAGVVDRPPLAAAGHPGQALEAVERLAAKGAAGGQLRARLQHQHPQTRLGQGQGRHPAGGTRSHHDGVRSGAASSPGVRTAGTGTGGAGCHGRSGWAGRGKGLAWIPGPGPDRPGRTRPSLTWLPRTWRPGPLLPGGRNGRPRQRPGGKLAGREAGEPGGPFSPITQAGSPGVTKPGAKQKPRHFIEGRGFRSWWRGGDLNS